MAERKKLMQVDYISDHSCGTYQIGEIDTLPDEAVKRHVADFGEYGYSQLRDFAIRILTQSQEAIYQHRVSGHGADAMAYASTPTPSAQAGEVEP